MEEMEYKVGVVFQSWGSLSIEAESKEELLEKLKDRDFIDSLPLPDNSEYIDDSFEVDFDSIDFMN